MHAGGKPRIVGCNDQSAAPGERKQALGHLGGGGGVEMCGRLVGQDNPEMRIAGGPRDRKPQRLATGKSDPAFAERPVAIGGSDFSEPGCVERIHQVAAQDTRPAERDIAGDGASKNMRSLADPCHAGAQGVGAVIGKFDAADDDATAGAGRQS